MSAYILLALANSPLVVTIDGADLPRVQHHRWRLSHSGFATTSNPPKDDARMHSVLLHRLILQAPKRMRVEFKNGDRLDCRRENLVLVAP